MSSCGLNTELHKHWDSLFHTLSAVSPVALLLCRSFYSHTCLSPDTLLLLFFFMSLLYSPISSHPVVELKCCHSTYSLCYISTVYVHLSEEWLHLFIHDSSFKLSCALKDSGSLKDLNSFGKKHLLGCVGHYQWLKTTAPRLGNEQHTHLCFCIT